MTSAISVALVGAGQIGGGYDVARHAPEAGAVFTHAGAYSKNGGFKLKTVCDPDPSRVSEFQARWGFTQGLGSAEELCRSFHDVISICTPDASHHAIVRSLLEAKCCKCIFVEKPLALTLDHVLEIIDMSVKHDIAVVVNHQRRFDAVLAGLRQKIADAPSNLLAGGGYYVKGLDHVGTTMIDTLTYLLGYPGSVLAYNKTYNRQAQEDTYEFILFYDDFNFTVKSVDSSRFEYSYHIFEIELLTREERICINDNSRQIETRILGNFAYAGVRVLDDRNPVRVDTGYDVSMLDAVAYVYDVVTSSRPHIINTPQVAYNNKLIVEKIKQSHLSQRVVEIKRNEWKR